MALALVQEVVSFPNNLDVHQKAPTSPENHGTFKYQAVLLYSLSNKKVPLQHQIMVNIMILYSSLDSKLKWV